MRHRCLSNDSRHKFEAQRVIDDDIVGFRRHFQLLQARRPTSVFPLQSLSKSLLYFFPLFCAEAVKVACYTRKPETIRLVALRRNTRKQKQ